MTSAGTAGTAGTGAPLGASAEEVRSSEPVWTGVQEDTGRIRARYTQPQIGVHGYLTPQAEWGDVERGNPLPYTLPPETRRAVGLTRETWRLEVVADPESDARLEAPLSKELGTALDFEGLLRLGSDHGVRYLKAVTCNNLGEPLGMGLWEGVPLRAVVWLARPTVNVRRVVYHGYHNGDPAQRFQSTLPIGRVLEDAPGELPVILAYKLNGQFLLGERGGPVRMVVPEAYGFKSVKWLQRVELTNTPAATDTYHLGNNDIDSPMKTFARFLRVPTTVRAGEPVPVTGIAQVGVSGLAKVQYWVRRADAPLPPEPPDAQPAFPTYAGGDWRDAEILPPPEPHEWAAALPEGAWPDVPLQFNPATGRPRTWPLRYTICHWAAELPPLGAGAHELRCRTVDQNGVAQPMPRPFPKGGRAEIQVVPLEVTA